MYGWFGRQIDIFLQGLCKWTAFANALIILGPVSADDVWPFHVNLEAVCRKVNGGKDGKVGVSFAASGAAYGSDLFQGLCGHLIRKAERLNGKGRGLGNDGYKHAGAYSCAAGAPEPAGPAGNAFSSSHHFH